MKKKIIILTTSLVLMLSASYAKSSVYQIPKYVTTVFTSDFTSARDIQWETYNGYYKASFTEMGKTLYAFYTADAEFMGIATHVSAGQLPSALRSFLNENYKGFWISDLYQFTIDTTPGFLITIENADRKIMLKAEAGECWSLYNEVKKA